MEKGDSCEVSLCRFRCVSKEEIISLLESLKSEKHTFKRSSDEVLKSNIIIGERLDDSLVGIAGITKRLGVPLLFIVVKQEFQGRNIGTRLMGKLISMVKRELSYIMLATWKNNEAAIRLFQKSGFKVFGADKFSYFMMLPLTKRGRLVFWILKKTFPLAYSAYRLLKNEFYILSAAIR